jgi:hypothetical protein
MMINNPRVSGLGSHNELTVLYDTQTGEIVHVHLFSSHDGSSLSEEVKDRLARETAMHRLSRRTPAPTLASFATLHVATEALVPGHAYHVDVKTRAIVQRQPPKST